MPRKRDNNAVMKPRKHSNRLNVSLIFSTSDADDFKSEQDFSDALSSCSRSTANTDTLRSGISYLSDPPYSPSSVSFPETPTTPQEGSQGWDSTPTASLSSAPYSPCPDRQISRVSDRSESIYDSLTPKKQEVSRSTSEISSASTSSSSLFIVPNELDPTTPTNIQTHTPALEWETTENMKLKMKNKNKDTPEVMRPQRTELPQDQPESPFSKLQRASLKKRKIPRKNSDDVTVMTPKRDHLNSSPGVTPPGSRHNSLSRNEDPTTPSPNKTRTNSESSRNSGEFKSRTLPRRIPDNKKTPDSKVSRSNSEMPTPPVRTTSRRSTSSSDSKNRTLERPGKQNSSRNQSRPNSIMETSADPVPTIIVPSDKNSLDTSREERRDGTLKRNGTLKKKKKAKKEETPKKKKSESLENLKKGETPKKQKSESVENLKKGETPKKQKSESVENLKKEETPKKQKPESLENLKKEETPKKQKPESLENLKKEEPAKTKELVRQEGPLKKQEPLIKDPEKKEELVFTMKPAVNVESEKENDKNLVNEKWPERNESVNEEEEAAHSIRRCDSKVIYNDFEEMEALLMEQERLVDNLEKERQEKVELERIKVEQDKQQEEMKDTIKTLEEEIVNVDCKMVKLKVCNEDQYDDLEDQKRSLHARLIEERGKQRHMDDLISLSGMSVYSENGLMLNQDIGDYSKRELLDQIKTLKKEKSELETTIKQLRCDGANEKRKQDKVIKDLMTQIRGFHNVPVQRQESTGLQETMAMITDLRSQLDQMKSQNKSQTKLIERLVTERNLHLVEMGRLKGNVEESIHLKEEVS